MFGVRFFKSIKIGFGFKSLFGVPMIKLSDTMAQDNRRVGYFFGKYSVVFSVSKNY